MPPQEPTLRDAIRRALEEAFAEDLDPDRWEYVGSSPATSHLTSRRVAGAHRPFLVGHVPTAPGTSAFIWWCSGCGCSWFAESESCSRN